MLCQQPNDSNRLWLGELEIKPESLRYVVCVTRELLEDSSVNIEQWLLDKANRAFRAEISHVIMVGDGFGKPMGILNPMAGIPIMETSEATRRASFLGKIWSPSADKFH